ncbi:MAG: sialidase family protein [Candidatus Latescibacterota bacterium]
MERFVISRDDDIYEAFPDVAMTSSGRLVCVFAECTHHRDRSYTRAMVTTSDDRGRTWSPKRGLSEPLHGDPKQDPWLNCPRVSYPGDGRLVDGLELFEEENAADLHPSGDGYVRMGERFYEKVFTGTGAFAV